MASTDLEQVLLELINSARLDPLGDAARYITSYSPLQSGAANIQNALSFFGVSGTLLLQQFAALMPAQPLAWSDQLATAARNHDQAMIAADTQSHQLPQEPNFGARIANQGYNFTTVGENIFAFADDPLFAHAGFMVDWGGGPGSGGMQTPPGHRLNIMNSAFREIGIGIVQESNPVTQVGPLVITQDLGSRGNSGVFILGVAYTDFNDDNFYSVGEGVSGLTVSLGAASTASSSSGGYALQSSATGVQAITLGGGGLSGPVTVTTGLTDGMNIKLDVIDGHTLRTSVSATILGAVTTVQGLGLTGLVLTTGAGSQSIVGTKGNDTLDSGEGIDTAVFNGNRAASTIINTTSGYTVSGPDGSDTLSNIERLHFSDESVALDISGNAGMTAKILGAVFGPSSVSSESYSRQYVGIGLSYLDGGMSYQDLIMLALNARLGAGFSNTAEVNLLYQNLAGVLPSAADLDYWVGTLTAGQFSQASLAVMAADLDLNKTNINLVGLAQTGIEFT